MSERPTRQGGLGVGVDQVYGAINDVEKQVKAINATLNANMGEDVDLPEIDQSFTPLFEIIEDELFVTLAYFVPGYAASLKTVMVRRDVATTNANYKTKRIKDSFDLTDEDRATAGSGSIEKRFNVPLKRNRVYDVILLAAFDNIDGSPHFNPESDLKFADYPANVLFTFTASQVPARLATAPNLVNGGGMMNSVDQYNTVYGGASVAADIDRLGRNWQTFTNSGVRIDRLVGGSLVTAGIQWIDIKGFIKLSTTFQTLGGKPACKLRKQIKPGETYTFGCLLAADSAVNNQKITIALVEQGTGDIIAKTTATNWLFSIIGSATAWTPTLVAVLRVPASYVMGNKQWLEMRFTGNPSDVCYTTHWQLERGEGSGIWQPHGEEMLLDAQSNITLVGGSGIPGAIGPGFIDRLGQKFGGSDGLEIGGLVY